MPLYVVVYIIDKDMAAREHIPARSITFDDRFNEPLVTESYDVAKKNRDDCAAMFPDGSYRVMQLMEMN